MGQINQGFRAILSNPNIYDVFQMIMGTRKARAIFSSNHIKAQKGYRVLDIGCGTAETRDFLPDVEYYGFDPNPHYIKSAQNRLRDVPGCTFFCATVDEVALNSLPKFDIVLAIGVLHHLDDENAVRLANMAKVALKSNGRLVLLDPCSVEGQSSVARFLNMIDRGQHIRTASGYRNLMNAAFETVTTEVRHDLMRFYTHLIMECMSA